MRIVYAFLTKSRQSAIAVISNNKGGLASLSISFYAAEIMIYNGRTDGARGVIADGHLFPERATMNTRSRYFAPSLHYGLV